MSNAYIIETAGQTAGIVVVERGGVRFFSSDRFYDTLDGIFFSSLRTARAAVVEHQRKAAERYVSQGGLAASSRQFDAARSAAA